jgi:hypothetical protein
VFYWDAQVTATLFAAPDDHGRPGTFSAMV